MKKMMLALAPLATVLAATSAMAGPARPAPVPCPDPQYQTIATDNAAPQQNQFSPAVWAVPHANRNDPTPNRMFLHTFQWKDEKCCEVMRATLTVRVRSLSGATSRTASDAGNDSMSLWHNGAALAGAGGFIWPLGTPAGTVSTRTIVLTPAMLAAINSNNMLSLAVQDDTAVEALQVELHRCCIKKR